MDCIAIYKALYRLKYPPPNVAGVSVGCSCCVATYASRVDVVLPTSLQYNTCNFAHPFSNLVVMGSKYTVYVRRKNEPCGGSSSPGCSSMLFLTVIYCINISIRDEVFFPSFCVVCHRERNARTENVSGPQTLLNINSWTA